MLIEIAKGTRDDALRVVRSDGSRAESRFPKKGPVPHDAVHLFVERGLGMDRGFWGIVAAGRHPEDLQDIAKAAGHASASRAGPPEPHIVELLQAERLVECFEAGLWGGSVDPADLIAVAETACAASRVPCPALDAADVGAIAADIAGFARDWAALPVGATVSLLWP